jgi:hypothetical protein
MEQNNRHRNDPDEGSVEDEKSSDRSGIPSSATIVDWRPRGWVTITLVLLLGFLLLALSYLRDEAVPWDQDLMGPISATTNKDISAPVRIKTMLNGTSKMNLTALAGKPPWEWDTPTLATLLETHSAVLDNFRDLLEEKQEQWHPSSALWWIEDFGNSPAWQEIILLKQVEAAYLSRREQEEAAFVAALDLAVLAHLLERIYAWPSFMRRSFDLQYHSAQSVAMLLKNTRLSAEKLHRIQEDECRPWAPLESALSEAMEGYYSFEKRLIVGPRPGEPPLPPNSLPARSGWLYFKPNATLHLFSTSFRALKDEALLTPFARLDTIGTRTIHHSRMNNHGFTGPNQSGEEYFYKRIQDYLPMLDDHSQASARHALIMTLFAIRGHIAKNGALPLSLDDLVPDFLPKPIFDPYSNEPLRYDSAKGLIYSVGAGLKDNGGRPTPIPFGDSAVPTLEIGISIARAVSAEGKKEP